MSFARPTRAELVRRAQEDVNARLPGVDALLDRSVLRVLATVSAGAVHGLYGNLAYLAAQAFVDTADAPHLLRWADLWGKARLDGGFAAGDVVVTGGEGLEVPVSSELIRGDGLSYLTTDLGIISGGEATVPVAAVLIGDDGNAVAGVTLTFVSPISGIDAVATVDTGGLIGGADLEDLEDLRDRVLRRIRRPPRGGHLTDFEEWALEVGGVTRAWSFADWMGAGTVGVLFVRDDDVGSIIPDAGELTEVEDYIDGHVDPETGLTVGRPATVELYVIAPTPVDLDYTIRVDPDTAEVQAAVEAELADLHAREAEPGGTLYISRIREAVSHAAGESDNTVTSPSADVVSGAGELSVLGTVTFV